MKYWFRLNTCWCNRTIRLALFDCPFLNYFERLLNYYSLFRSSPRICGASDSSINSFGVAAPHAGQAYLFSAGT
jgi:hypothetical protein